MQNREQPVADDREVGNLGAEKAYAFIDGVRVAFDVGALGFGANGTISKSGSLITAITVEGFCSLLSLVVAIHEIVNVCGQQCNRRDGRTVASTSHAPTEYSTYLSFRMISILVSFVGMALLASDIATETTTAKSTIGIVAISLGIFASRALSGTRHKPARVVLQNNDDDIELALVTDPPPPPAPREEVLLMTEVPPIANHAPQLRQNQFHQPEPASTGPLQQRDRVPSKKAGYVKRSKSPKTPALLVRDDTQAPRMN